MNQQEDYSFKIRRLPDPRSPTEGINRTPIQVVQKQGLQDYSDDVEMIDPDIVTADHFSTITAMDESPASSTSGSYLSTCDDFDDIDGSMFTDPSIAVSGFSNDNSVVEPLLLDNKQTVEPLLLDNKQTTDSSLSNDKQTENDNKISMQGQNKLSIFVGDENAPPVFSYPKYAIRKTLYTTPVNKSDRSPLESVQNVMFPSTPPSRYATQSPQFILRQKQWRRIQDERQKMGFANENILPPLADLTASAPGKLTKKPKIDVYEYD